MSEGASLKVAIASTWCDLEPFIVTIISTTPCKLYYVCCRSKAAATKATSSFLLDFLPLLQLLHYSVSSSSTSCSVENGVEGPHRHSTQPHLLDFPCNLLNVLRTTLWESPHDLQKLEFSTSAFEKSSCLKSFIFFIFTKTRLNTLAPTASMLGLAVLKVD